MKKLFQSTITALTLLPLLLSGQVSSDSDQSDVYDLSPFEVNTSGDVGYQSSNSLSGSRVNTPIKELPVAIQILNQEFLGDIGATNWEEASYLVN